MKQLFEYIGYNPEEGAEPKWDDVKKALEEKFVPIAQIGDRPDLLKPFIDESFGKKSRKVQVDIIKVMKDNGLDAPHSEFEKIPTIEELLPLAVKKFKSQIEEKAAKDKTGDETLKAKLQETETERDRFKNLFEKKDNEFTSFKDQTIQDQTKAKLDSFREKLIGGVKWKKDITGLEKDGFRVKFGEKYDIKVNDEGKFNLKDKEGKTVYNPSKPTEILTPEAAISIFAKENKVDDSAPYTGKKDKKTGATKEKVDTDPPKNRRRANPRFSGRVEVED
jgi:hypothetical protein